MKNSRLKGFLILISILLGVDFLVFLGIYLVNWFQFDASVNSAPRWLYAFSSTYYFIVIGVVLIFALLAVFVWYKLNKNKKL